MSILIFISRALRTSDVTTITFDHERFNGQCLHLNASWFETQPVDKLLSWSRISSVSTCKCTNRNCIWPQLAATKFLRVKRLRQVTYEYIIKYVVDAVAANAPGYTAACRLIVKPLVLDVPTCTAMCLSRHNDARDPSSERWKFGTEMAGI